MIISKQPLPYHPVYCGTTYRIEGADPGTVTKVEIIAGGRTAAVKKMTGAAEFTLNASPVLLDVAQFGPIAAAECRVVAPIRTITSQIKAGSVLSAVVPCTAASRELPMLTPLSDLTGIVPLYPGESDEVALLTPAGLIEARIVLHGEEETVVTLASVAATGGISAVVLSRPAIEGAVREKGYLPSRFTSAELQVDFDGERCAVRRYDLAAAPKQSIRLAWINPYGMIDRYTFPTLSEHVAPGVANTGTGALSAKPRKSLNVASEYEPEAMMRHLATLSAAPKVWIDYGGSFDPVTCTAKEVTIRSGELTRLEITVSGASQRLQFA